MRLPAVRMHTSQSEIWTASKVRRYASEADIAFVKPMLLVDLNREDLPRRQEAAELQQAL